MRHAYSRRICKAANYLQAGLGEERTGLPITSGLELWRLDGGAFGFSSFLGCGSGWMLVIWLWFYHQLFIINLASATGRKEFYYRHNAKP